MNRLHSKPSSLLGYLDFVLWPVVALLPFVLAAVFAVGMAKAHAAEPQEKPAAVETAPAGHDEQGTAAPEKATDLPKEVVEKLSAEQLVQVLHERERTRREALAEGTGTGTGMWVQNIVVPTVMFGSIFGIVLAIAYFNAIRDRRRHETLRAMVEKGANIPPELLTPPVRPKSDLRRGLVLVGVGAGLAGFFLFFHEQGMPAGLWSMGLIPALIGLGYLVAWRVESKRGKVS